MIAASIPGNSGIHTKMELNNNFEDVTTAFERQPYCYLQDSSVQNGDVIEDTSNGGRRLHDVNNYWTKQISCFHPDVECYIGHPAMANSTLSTSANSSEDGLSLIEESDNNGNNSNHSYKEINAALKMTVTNEQSFAAAGDAIVFHNRLVYTPTGYLEQQQTTIDFHEKYCWNQSGDSSPAAMNYRYRSSYNYQDDRYCSRIHEETCNQPLDEDEDFASCCSKTNYYHHPSDNYPEWSSAFPEAVVEDGDPLRPRKTRDLVPIKKRNTANKKERRRTQSINNAFSELRDRIPNVPRDTKLSKIKTLRLATSYISYLMNVLKNEKVEKGFEADLSSHSSARRKHNSTLCYEPSKFAPSPYRIIKNYGICSIGQDNKKKGRTGWPENEWAKELKSEQMQ